MGAVTSLSYLISLFMKVIWPRVAVHGRVFWADTRVSNRLTAFSAALTIVFGLAKVNAALVLLNSMFLTATFWFFRSMSSISTRNLFISTLAVISLLR